MKPKTKKFLGKALIALTIIGVAAGVIMLSGIRTFILAVVTTGVIAGLIWAGFALIESSEKDADKKDEGKVETKEN